eukprot:4476610-Prymnesium_polylepis.4
MPIHVHERRVEAELLLRPVEILVRRLRIEAEQVVVVEVAKRGRPDARQHLGHGHLPLGRPPKRVPAVRLPSGLDDCAFSSGTSAVGAREYGRVERTVHRRPSVPSQAAARPSSRGWSRGASPA